jgi:hypothetical protein
MPGWAALAPIKQFMREVKRRNPGRSSDRQLTLALDLMTKLKDGNAGYFTANPAAVQHLNHLLQQDRVYLAHEYLDEHWELFQFSEMVVRLAEAKLAYVCSATLTENLDAYAVPQGLAAVVAATDDPVMRETVRDYATNKRFRRDLFARGSAAITPAEHRRTLSELKFALVVPRKTLSRCFLTGARIPTRLVPAGSLDQLSLPVSSSLTALLLCFQTETSWSRPAAPSRSPA